MRRRSTGAPGGDGLHHVLDARTGRPVRGVVATWAVADEAAVADGLATALFFTEEHRLARQFGFEHVRMHADGQVDMSRDFPDFSGGVRLS